MLNGVINLIKPPGMTSSDAVVFIRKLLDIKKVGHTGTLDPEAAGVLPICIGKATKAADYIMNSRKKYICGIILGIETDTCDITGDVISVSDIDSVIISREKVFETIMGFKGEYLQEPPMFSAIKVGGRKLYELARQGKTAAVPSRLVSIYDIQVIDYDESDNIYTFEVECSKGTYIRSLCRDIGRKLGCGAAMSFLIRTRSGDFDIQNGHTLDEIIMAEKTNSVSKLIIPVDKVLSHYMPGMTLKDDVFNQLLNGNIIDMENITDTTDTINNKKLFRVYCKGYFIGLGCCDQNTGKVKMKNVLFEDRR